MVHQYWLLALPILVLDAAQGVNAIQVKKSKPSPAGLHVLPLIADNSADYHSWITQVAAGTPPQKMRLNLDIAKSTTCKSFLLVAGVYVIDNFRVHL